MDGGTAQARIWGDSTTIVPHLILCNEKPGSDKFLASRPAILANPDQQKFSRRLLCHAKPLMAAFF